MDSPRKANTQVSVESKQKRVRFLLTAEGLGVLCEALTAHEGHGSERLLHENLSDWR